MDLGNDFDFKTDISKTFDTSAEALSSQQAICVLIKAFQDVDERQRKSVRQAFEQWSLLWKQFEYQNVGNDLPSILAVPTKSSIFYHNNSARSQLGLAFDF